MMPSPVSVPRDRLLYVIRALGITVDLDAITRVSLLPDRVVVDWIDLHRRPHQEYTFTVPVAP